MFMRVALEIHREDLNLVQETYDLMSNKYYTHATPSLFNAATNHPQMSSCFLVDIKDDSASGIFETLTQAMHISKFAGGLGINASHIRAKGSPLSTGGVSNGIISMIKVFEAMSKFISQCGNKRASSIAFFIEPWHPEVFEFLDLRKNTGKEEMRSRGIFTALWVPDLFMQRVERNENWSLFCPNVARGLNDVYGGDFERLYCRYEHEGMACRTVSAQKLWRAVVESQIETGTPYIVYKDAANRKSNQKNLGVLKCSNLCSEILEYTGGSEIAVCNLASIALPTFIEEGVFNFGKLRDVTKVIVRNLDKVIDRNFYPIVETRASNLRHRPMGIGVQGLADVFAIMKYPFASEEARALNKSIFETIYFGALESSCEVARERGVYESYHKSYVKSVLSLRERCDIKGIAHITGGGLSDNIIRILPPNCCAEVRKGTWEIPPIFPFLQEKGGVAEAEMYHVFNMGVGMILVLPPNEIDTAIAALQELGESASLIGEIAHDERCVRII